MMIRLRVEAGLENCITRGTVVQRDPAGNALAIASTEDGEYRLRFPGLATFAYLPGANEVRVAPDANTPRSVVEDLFRTAALPLLLQAEGYEAIHASAVQMPGGVVAFCGFSGTGKTTVAYALSQRGYDLWADDVVLWSSSGVGGNLPSSSRLPHTVNLRPESRRFFGLVPDADVVVGTARSEEDQVGAIAVLAPVAAPVLKITPLSLDVALTAILPHVHCFFAAEGRARKTAAAYLDLVSRIPVLRFQFAADFAHFDAALDLLEDRLRQAIAGV
jgi:hypothetical protein